MAKLTPRQRQIARLLASGMTQREIAHELRLSRHTVYGYTKLMRARTQKTTVEIAVNASAQS